jgi:GTPase Era involved in 16S rRNA processing
MQIPAGTSMDSKRHAPAKSILTFHFWERALPFFRVCTELFSMMIRPFPVAGLYRKKALQSLPGAFMVRSQGAKHPVCEVALGGAMDEEKLLQERHSEILDEERRILKGIHEIAQELDRHSEISEQARGILEHLDELFLLVVVGEVKSGKSCFINALAGSRICPEGPIPVTDRIHILHYGPSETERTLADFVVEKTFPLDILRNLSIVDTPGTNSIVRRHQEITEGFIPKADLILFVTSIDRPFTETEHQFLSYISKQWRKKIVVILTKVDMRTEDEISQVIDYIAENAKAKLDITPLIFPVSARDGLLGREQGDEWLVEKSGMPHMEVYIREKLTDTEKLKLKLASPLESALSILGKLEGELTARSEILDKDFNTLNQLDAQVTENCRELEERCFKCITDIYDLLREFERRGTNFLEEKITLKKFNTIRDAERFKTLFDKEVVADLKDRVDEAMHGGVDWLMRQNIALYEKSVRFLNERVETKKYKESVVGIEQTSFEYNREKIFGAMKDGFKNHVQDFDVKGECNRVVDSAYRGLLGFLGVELGAVGLGVVAATIFSTLWLDITGVLMAGAVALTGFFILPAKKRQAVKQFSAKVDGLITEFRKTLIKEFDREINAALENIRASYKPYVTFYKAECSRIDEHQREIEGFKSALLGLRNRIEEIEEDGSPGSTSNGG